MSGAVPQHAQGQIYLYIYRTDFTEQVPTKQITFFKIRNPHW
jgi:hypothetical protein